MQEARESAEEFLRSLAPGLSAFSFVTGSAFLLRPLERQLLEQLARIYRRKLSRRQIERILSRERLRRFERMSQGMELTFFVPVVGNLIKAGVGARLLQSIGREMILALEKDRNAFRNGLRAERKRN